MASQQGKILLVDDDETVLNILSESLTQQGYGIVKAFNGEQAVALAIQEEPDLIVSDIVMPKMDGWDLCYTLRNMPSTRNTPFIFLTSLDKTPDRVLGIKLGADDYLTKPFSPKEVSFKIKAILKRVHMRREFLEKKEAEAPETDARLLLSDVIEYLRNTQRTGLLAIYGPQGRGVIYIKEGKPVHASIGAQKGEKAVYEIVRMGQSAQIKFLEKEYSNLKENLSMPWEQLMHRIIKRPEQS